VKFRVVTLEARQVELVWKDAKGEPFATFDKVQAQYAAGGKRVKFLVNAGIYEPGSVPSGLHHQNGRRLSLNNSRKRAVRAAEAWMVA
jgi:uncharacterized protein YigE (DUF2233 family)